MSFQVLLENKKVFDKVGISRWHDAGYIGTRGLSGTVEHPVVHPEWNGQVIDPMLDPNSMSDDGHAYWSSMVHLQVAPGRKLVSLPISCTMAGDTVTGNLVDKVIPYMVANKVDTVFASLKFGVTGFGSAYKPVLDFCTLFNSIGNDNTSDFSKLAADEEWLGVGAVDEYFNPQYYSSVSEFIDYCGIAPIYAPTIYGEAALFNGTSCAGPFISGEAALVNDFFLDKVGRSLGQEEMTNFFMYNRIDLGVFGFDTKTGWGLPILPDPKTINPYRWLKRNIELTLGSKEMLVDGKSFMMDVAPVVISNRTMMPLRFPMEAVGCQVLWDPMNPTKVKIIKDL
jgi:hypothetical protein